MFEEIDKRTDLTMYEKGEQSKEKFKEAYKSYDIYTLIELAIKKQIKYEPNVKAEDLEVIAIKELIDDKSKEINPVDLNLLIQKLEIRENFDIEEINISKKKLLADEELEKLTKSLSEKGLNYTRVFIRYHQNIATEEECTLAEDINRKLKIKEIDKEIELLEEFQTKLKEISNKKKIKL